MTALARLRLEPLAIGLLSGVLGLVSMRASAAEQAQLTPLQSQGKALYNQTCIYCHAAGVWGSNRLARRMDKDLAILENRSDLNVAAIRAVVRMGVGSMPAYRKTEVSDTDIEAIAAYLTRPSR